MKGEYKSKDGSDCVGRKENIRVKMGRIMSDERII